MNIIRAFWGHRGQTECVSVCQCRFTSPALTSSSAQTHWTTGPPSPPSLWSCLHRRRPTVRSAEGCFFPLANSRRARHCGAAYPRCSSPAPEGQCSQRAGTWRPVCCAGPGSRWSAAWRQNLGSWRARGTSGGTELSIDVLVEDEGATKSSSRHAGISKLPRWFSFSVHETQKVKHFTGYSSAYWCNWVKSLDIMCLLSFVLMTFYNAADLKMCQN